MGCNCKSRDDMIAQTIKVWSNVVWESAEEKAEANRRVKVCLSSGREGQPCKHNKNLTCLQNGLWIPAMARQMSSCCPINKWCDGG